MGKDASGTTINTSAYVGRLLESIPAGYTVWKDGSTYRAEANFSGGTDYSSDTFSTLWNSMVSTGRSIFLRKATYTVGATNLDLVADLDISSEAGAIIEGDAAQTRDIFVSSAACDNLKMRNLHIKDANKAISLTHASKNVTLENIYGEDCLWVARLVTASELASDFTGCHISGLVDVFDAAGSHTGHTLSMVGRRSTIGNIYASASTRDGPAVYVLKSEDITVDNVVGYSCYDYLVVVDSCNRIAVSNIIDEYNLHWGAVGVKTAYATGSDITLSNIQQYNVQANQSVRIETGGGYALKNVVLNGFILNGGDGTGLTITGNNGDLTNVSVSNGIVKNFGQGASDDWTESGIMVTGKNNSTVDVKFHNVTSTDDQGSATQEYGMSVIARQDWTYPCAITITVKDCDLSGNKTGTLNSQAQGSGSITPLYIHNQGYITENSGITGAIATGATVTHGLAGTPTAVTVTAAESGPTDIYVSAVGASTFAINYGGGGTKTFYWQAEYKP